MATYDAAAVSDTAIAFQKGITLQQGRALRDNLTATAQGAAGAPKIASKIVSGAGTTVFGGMANFGGLIAWGTLRSPVESGGSSLTIAAGTDASTFAVGSIVATVAPDTHTPFTLFVDFATGAWRCAHDTMGGGIGAATVTTGTLAGVAGITHFRISGGLASYIVNLQGGQSLT